MATNKQKALAKHLGIKPSEVEGSGIEYDADGQKWLVMTDSEADEFIANRIPDDLWMFDYDFVRAHFHDSVDIDKRDYQAMQEKMAERMNGIVRALIVDVDRLISDAVLSVGRGQFISSYDGREEEVKIGSTYYYLYQIN